MVNFLPASHFLFQIANVFIFLSYIQLNLIGLRLTLLIGSFFYGLWALIILEISGDTFLWNVCHIIINAALVIPLIVNAWPVRLRGEEKDIYTKYFKNNLSKKNFKFLLGKAKRKEVQIGATQVIQQGNPFDELLFIYKIPQSKCVQIYYKDVPTVASLPGDFIGMIEAKMHLTKARSKKFQEKEDKKDQKTISRMKTLSQEKLIWDISVKINNTNITDNRSVVYYRWELEDLNNILNNEEHGNTILNALYSKWLNRTISLIHEAQDRIIRHNSMQEPKMSMDDRNGSFKSGVTRKDTDNKKYEISALNEAAEIPHVITNPIKTKDFKRPQSNKKRAQGKAKSKTKNKSRSKTKNKKNKGTKNK